MRSASEFVLFFLTIGKLTAKLFVIAVFYAGNYPFSLPKSSTLTSPHYLQGIF